MKKLNILLFICQVCQTQGILEVGKSDELAVDLFTNYQKDVRPRCGVNNTVRVILDLALRQIVELNEPKQILHTNCWKRMTWNDCRLSWNSSKYDNINQIIVPVNKVWYPDLTLYDSAVAVGDHMGDYRIGVSSTGDIRQYLPVILVSLCTIDVSVFPFDHQVCNLTFGMWMHNGLDVDIAPLGDADLTEYVQHVEWELISLNAYRIVDIYVGVPYPQVKYKLILRRKPLFYLINLIFPCILISSVALLGFILPSDSGEKVNLEVTVLLSLAVFQLIVLDTMPPSSETLPIIGLYFAATMVMVALSCLMTVFVLNIHFRGRTDSRAPRILRHIIIGCLGRIFCIQSTYPSHSIQNKTPQGSQNNEGLTNSNIAKGHAAIFQIDIPSRKPKDLKNNNNENNTSNESNHVLMEFPDNFTEMLQVQTKILSSLECLTRKLCKGDNARRNTDEWYLMAIILDRFFLLLFLVITVILVSVFMFRYLI